MKNEVGIININREIFNYLRFEDNILMFAEREDQLHKLLNVLKKESKKIEIKMKY